MRRIRLLAIVFAVGIGACHFDDSFQIDVSVDPGRPGAAFREACTAQAAASCAYQERCNAYVFARFWPDLATCVERSMLACQLFASDPHANRDEDFIRGCSLPDDFPCSSDPAYEDALTDYRQTCPETAGDLDDGSSCATSVACASSFCELDYPGQVCGTCRAFPCDVCAEGQSCAVQIDGTVLCFTRLEDGAPCADHDSCASGYCGAGVCAPRAQEGEPCDGEADNCVTTSQVALFCNPTTLRCERVAILQAGQSCNATTQDSSVCGGGSTCVRHNGMDTCIAPAADGTPCFTGQGLSCLPPARCIDAFCRFLSPLACTLE